jgi:uncharacterized integral membrane protein
MDKSAIATEDTEAADDPRILFTAGTLFMLLYTTVCFFIVVNQSHCDYFCIDGYVSGVPLIIIWFSNFFMGIFILMRTTYFL